MIPLPSLLLAAALAAPDSSPIPGYAFWPDQAGDSFLIQAVDLGPQPPVDPTPERVERAAATIRRFVYGHPAVFGLDREADSLVVMNAYTMGAGMRVDFEQRHRGRPVFSASFYADVSSDLERVLQAQGRFDEGITLDPTPRLTRAQAIAIAVARHPGARKEPTVRGPGYTTFYGGPCLLYTVRVPSPGGSGYGFIVGVDAHDGSIRGDMADPGPGR